jgi:hypothetical protein
MYTFSYSQNSTWTIPGVIYVGDPATLILPLPAQNRDFNDIILTVNSPDFPKDTDIDFHRIVLERRLNTGRLLIEFTAFEPGILEFPVIEAGGERFSGLTVTVNSVIESTGSVLELSKPASSLALPGTIMLIYVILAFFILLVLLVIWFILRGRFFIQKCIERWKYWRIFILIKNTEKYLHKLLLKGVNKRVILDKLSDDLRSFLTFITGNNCHSLTAGEFELLPDIYPGNIGDFFRRCDKFRFSGSEIKLEDISKLLDDLRTLIDLFYIKMYKQKLWSV